MTDTLFLTPGSGNSFKPALVMRQTDRRCAVRHLDVLAGENRLPPHLAINPRGKLPYLVLADGRGIAESNAIAWWLAEGTPLMPTSAAGRAQALQWMIFEQTSLEPNISPARFFTHVVPSQRDAHLDEIPRWLDGGHRALAILDTHLVARDFITDDGYGVADVAVFGYTHLAGEGGFDLSRYAGIARWMRNVRQTPGYAEIDALLAA